MQVVQTFSMPSTIANKACDQRSLIEGQAIFGAFIKRKSGYWEL